MQNGLKELWALHQIDMKILDLEKKLAALDSGVEAKKSRDTARAVSDEAASRLHSIETELADIDLNVKSTEAKRAELEKKLYSGKITNPKELESMQQEIEMLKRNKDRLETRELELMDEQTKAKTLAAEAKEALDKSQAQLDSILGDSASARAELEAQLEKAMSARENARKAASEFPALIRKYDSLRPRLAKVAMSGVTDTHKTCQVCRVLVSGHVFADLRSGEEVVTCESCGRILYLLPNSEG